MGFSYEVLTEQEAMAERFQLMKEGIYEGVVTSSLDTKSSSGNPMMDILVTVYDDNGKAHEIRDFLVFTKNMMWKVVHFSDSAGITEDYLKGTLCSKIAVDKRVVVEIKVEDGKEIPEGKLNGKPIGSKYPDKNKISEYVKRSSPLAELSKSTQTTQHNNESTKFNTDFDLPTY